MSKLTKIAGQLKNKKLSLSPLLNITNLGYLARLVIDQPYVKKKSQGSLVPFRISRVSRVGTVAQDFTSMRERQKNLDIAVACLDAANIEYFVIPDVSWTSYKVGVEAKDKAKFLNELSKKYSDTGVYIAMINKLQAAFKKRQIISSRRSLERFSEADVIRIYSFTLAPNHDALADDTDGCDVEFWERTDNPERSDYVEQKITELRVNIKPSSLINTLVAPAINVYTGVLPLDEVTVDSIAIGDKQYRTYDIFNQKTLQAVDFPIDIVYSWVDGKDPEWKAKFNKYKGVTEDISNRNNTNSRYMDRQELKYSLRSIHMYAPFVRNIYIATDGQVPDWLDQSVPGVKVVDHKDFFSDPSLLPVFNSHAIGAQLHHIEGLSDRYLYLNDDIMFGKLIDAQKFFYANGIAKVPVSEALIHAGSPKSYEPAPSSAGKNVRKVLEQSFGRYITNKYKHSPIPQIKEVAREIEQKYPDIVRQTVSSRFRDPDDLQFASQFHHSYSMITGRAVETSMKSVIVDISRVGADKVLNRLLKRRDANTVCLNESETPEHRNKEVGDMVHNFFETYYPYPSPWEKVE